MLTREKILEALATIKDPVSGRNVVEAGMISGLAIRDEGRVGFLITIPPHQHAEKSWLQGACEQVVMAIPGVNNVTAVLTAEATQTVKPYIESAQLKKASWNTQPISHVRRVIAIASGKGGVGKSTTAVNLAHALHAQKKQVGILDADIYGPSVPRLMGLTGMPESRNGKILPLRKQGIACMSMGLLVGEESALVWRGPQLTKTLNQLLRTVEWGTHDAPLDVLIIDMPPGTGDVHLSLVQQAPVDGAVIVTTPQDVAVADARKCIDMFHKTRVPILGIIENMSGFREPASGVIYPIFGAGGGRRLAEATHTPFLGKIPIEIALREASDAGVQYKDDAGVYAKIAALI